MTRELKYLELIESMTLEQAIAHLEQYASWTDSVTIGNWERMEGYQSTDGKLLWRLDCVHTIDMLKFCAAIQVIKANIRK